MTLNLKSFSPAELNQLTISYLPPIMTGILVVVLASMLASITWRILPSSTEVAPLILLSTKNDQIASNQASNENQVYKQIPNWHLFGVVEKKRAAPKRVAQPVAPKEAPDTQLRFTLKGVVASADPTSAWAIIADRSGNEDTYGVDSPLPGGATLKEIYSDRIILLHNGRLETLRLPKTGVSSAIKRGSKRQSASRSNRRNKKNTRSTRRQPSGQVNRVSSAGTAILKDYREKLINDPQSVMNSVRAEPYRQGGRLQGYRIFPGSDKSLFGSLGLEPGDVVTSINGISLDSPLKGLEVMQNIQDATEMNVEVLRNGVNQTFVVPMN